MGLNRELHGQTLDVYVDGKLHKTCVMEGVTKVNADADVYITPNGGLMGGLQISGIGTAQQIRNKHTIFTRRVTVEEEYLETFSINNATSTVFENNEVGSSFEI